MKPKLIPCILLFAFQIEGALAEEGGSGHYQPGAIASFMDGVAAEETLLFRYNFLSWQAGVDAGRTLPIAGLVTAGADIDSIAHGFTVFWRPSWGTINDQWSYATSLTVPFVDLNISADIVTPLGTIRRSQGIEDVGDIVVMPVMLNQKFDDDFSINYRLGVYAPTGSYEVGSLANTGKNFWTIEPAVGFMYLGQQNGIEASLFLGADFNFENPDTNYQSGTQIHLDGTFAQHFPLCGGVAGVGLSSYWYEQIESDSGPGARLGDFEARSVGAGPVISYIHKFGGADILAELKWLNELDTKNRPSGDFIWFKLSTKF